MSELELGVKAHITTLGSRPRVAIQTLGCKVNQSESDELVAGFRDAGFAITSFEDPADVYVVNTCTVTHVADAKSRQILRQATRRNENALVIATGCYATVAAHRFPLDGVVLVRNRDKAQLVEIARAHLERGATSDSRARLGALGKAEQPNRRNRPNLKVQDGCDSACSYCIIPRARGRSRSRTPEACVERVRALVREGHKEIVITGVDLGSYGEDLDPVVDLGGLLRLLLSETDAHRFRLSSVEPGDFKLSWLELWFDPRLCRHLHVPLQAGSDHILGLMRRKYVRAQYLQMLEACRDVPDMAITTDVITGFPGEGRAEFDEGFDFISSCEFDGMHVFPYSERSGTAAVKFEGRVTETEKKARAARLRDVGEEGRNRHVRHNLGSIQEIVWEEEVNNIWRGTSGNNLRVYSNDRGIQESLVDFRRISGVIGNGCWGEAVEGPGRELSLLAV